MQFDQHLVRRFVQLLGIYPPGNLVQAEHRRDRRRAADARAGSRTGRACACMFRADGARLEVPQDRNLFELGRRRRRRRSSAPLDPADFGDRSARDARVDRELPTPRL